MTYLKYIQYFYLAFALFFAYDAFTKYNNNQDYILSIAIAIVAFGMFWFRRHFYKKHNNK